VVRAAAAEVGKGTGAGQSTLSMHPSCGLGNEGQVFRCSFFARLTPAAKERRADYFGESPAGMPDILVTMAGNLFDVFVVGATDSSAAGETRLAAALSAKHGVPLATVAKAISAKNLRAGQGLEQAQAQALVRHLQSIGAVTVIRPAGAHAQGHAAPPAAGSRGTVAQTGAVGSVGPPLARTSAAMPAAGGGWPGAPAPLSNEPAADPFAHLPSPPQAAPANAGAADPFQPGRPVSPAPGAGAHGRATGSLPAVGPSRSSASGLAVDASPGPKLELARGDRVAASDEDMSAARSRAAGSALSLREVGMSGNSGVAMDEDPRNLNLVRCVQHGLYYDKTKASGCRKCLSPAREVAAKMMAEAAPVHVGDLRRKPAKRAFLGLAFSVVLGFLPAVYYCFGPGAGEVRKVRVEQELLSRQPGTEEILKRFDQLDKQVGDLHEQATRNTAIVWVAVASVSMLAWYKIT
jgi:hypothetical protein